MKHNFFFKGFFKKRGYYNLNHIAPDQYRSDKAFAAGTSQRQWLQASELFETQPDGQQTLTAQGRVALDAAFLHLGNDAEQSPLMVEGYSQAPDEADQLSISRTRALLVRSYLQNHFLLDAGNLGTVSLKHSPPEAAGRSDWDGVCLVLLRRSR